MEKFIIEGGAPLHGEIPVRGAKNSTNQCIAACLLTEEDCVLENMPLIDDARKLLEVIEKMGGEVEYGFGGDERTVRVNAKSIDPSKIDQDLVREMRFSVVLFGALLARFGEVRLASPGGDKIGARQIDTHLEAFRALGAEVIHEEDYYTIKATKLTGTRIILDEFSVTGTANAILAALFAEGTTTIKNTAAEPHIDNLMEMLNAMGAKVRWAGNHVIEVESVEKLGGTKHAINPDYLEMWTFIALGAATQSELAIRPFVPEYLDLELLRFREMGGQYEMDGDTLLLKHSGRLEAPKARIHSMPYPGIAADNLPLFVVLATQAEGSTLIVEWMYEGRQKYVHDLKKMGADVTVLDQHRVMVKGPTPLYGKEATSYDIRAGATLIVAALIAQGKSTITNAEVVDRGYEKIEDRLTAIGAKIKRVKD